MTKLGCLKEAIEIAKAYAGSSASKDYTAMASMIEDVYRKLLELSQEASR